MCVHIYIYIYIYISLSLSLSLYNVDPKLGSELIEAHFQDLGLWVGFLDLSGL